MNALMEQGGFASVAVQWINSALLLALYLFVARHAKDGRACRSWRDTRVCMFAGITVILLWFYVLPAVEPELFDRIRDWQPVALTAYVFFKVAYWAMLLVGIEHLRNEERAALRRPWVLGFAAMYGAITMGLRPTVDAAMAFQSLIAIPVLAIGMVHMRALRGQQGDVGPKLMVSVLGLQLVVWLAYAAAFLGPALGMYQLTASPLALFWLANAYSDTLLDSALTIAMVVVLIEQMHRRIESGTSVRLARIHAQQEAVVSLVKRPEIAAGDFPGLAREVARSAAGTFGVERVSIWTFSDDRKELTCCVLYTRSSAEYSSGAVLRARDLPDYFAALEAATFIDANEAHFDPRTHELLDPYLKDNDIGSMLDVRIRGASGFIGVLCHEHVGGQRSWHDDEISFAGFLADQLGQTLANHRALEAERQRDEFERQLRHSQKLEAIGQLAGGVAHDFNNMLCAIMGYTSLARDRMPESSVECLDQIDGASARAAELTRKLLSFSRRQVLTNTVVEVNEVVRDMVEMMRRVTRESIEIEVSLDEKAGRALVDLSEVEQVLLNICNNACDAMPGGGRLRLATRAVEGSEPKVSISISDTGTGMSCEVLGRIFEPFFTTKPPGEGTGLGLAMSYGIVQQHGGQLRVESEPGTGTTFEIILPTVATPKTERAAPTARPLQGGTETLLVVEDEAAVRALMHSVLSNAGYDVLLAEDGAVAIDVYSKRADDIDAVLLDSVLPRASGAEVLSHIRAIQPTVPVICTSGYMAETPAAPFDGLLAKPFTRGGLLNAVRSALDQATTRA